MRKPEKVLEEVIKWAKNNKDVRVIILTGSRAVPGNRIDLLSDYDIEIVVDNANQFLTSETWLSSFGDILTIIRVDEGLNLRMALYKDYVRIDFRILSREDFEQYVIRPELGKHLDIGYKVLLDKDNLSKDLRRSEYTAYDVRKPTAEEFSNTVSDFWWDAAYVAKSLWREELFFAKFMLDSVIRFSYLQKVIEWHLGLQYGWKISTGKSGRRFKQLLDTETLLELETTFADSNIVKNWEALYNALKLFRRLAQTIAEKLDYIYPFELDSNMSEYFEKIKKLEIGAIDVK